MPAKKKTIVTLAKSAGFCFGVRRALDIAKKVAKSKYRIEMLHDIVHNEEVIKDIKKSGIKKVNCLKEGSNKALLIQAHGMPKNIVKKAKRLGYRIMDATCPMVYEIHKIASSMEKEGRTIIIIGDKNHIEVKGIADNLRKRPLIIANKKDIRAQRIRNIKKGGVVVQSTQNVIKTEKIIDALRKSIKDLKVFNTICGITKKKQKEIRTMPLENDVMIIIGSRNSGNTKRLYEISKSLNKRSYWVETEKSLKKVWFKDARKIGVTAGASTPDYTIKSVLDRIVELTESK